MADQQEGKKFGGFKPASARPATPRTSSSPLQKVKRRLQAITAEVLEAVQATDEQGVLLDDPPKEEEPPIESSFTQSEAVLWLVDGKTIVDWKCKYGCTPTRLSRGVTHHWQCAFWSNEGKNQTPIDRMKP